MSDQQKIFLGLGSNLGERYNNLNNAILLLNSHPHIWIIEKSHIYQSPAMYISEQDDFYNMVIQIETNLIPIELLNEVKLIEKKLGRKITVKKNMSRNIDIDILAIGELQIYSSILEVPHPAIIERKFVLKPWNDIDPDFIVPGHNATVSKLLKNTGDLSKVRMVLILDEEGMS